MYSAEMGIDSGRFGVLLDFGLPAYERLGHHLYLRGELGTAYTQFGGHDAAADAPSPSGVTWWAGGRVGYAFAADDFVFFTFSPGMSVAPMLSVTSAGAYRFGVSLHPSVLLGVGRFALTLGPAFEIVAHRGGPWPIDVATFNPGVRVGIGAAY
jgi:hypothetical protein